MRNVFLLFALCAAASGCMSSQEIAARQQAADNSTCVSYGLKFGTSEYAQCRQNIAAQRHAAEQTDKAIQAANTRAAIIATPENRGPCVVPNSMAAIYAPLYCR